MPDEAENTANVQLTEEDMERERRFLADLGFTSPRTGTLLARPFAEPYSSWSFVVPTAWYAQEPASHIAPRSLQRDLPLLRIAVEKAYAGWETAIHAGWDWDGFFETWQRQLTVCKNELIPIGDAFAPWSRFQAFRLDNHSGPICNSIRPDLARTAHALHCLSEPLTAWCNSAGQTGKLDPLNPAHQFWNAYLWKVSSAAFTPVSALSHPSSQGEWTAICSGGQWHPVCEVTSFEEQTQESVAELSDSKQDRLRFYRLSSNIGYLRIPTLSYSVAKQAEDQQKEIINGLTAVSNLVVDLRGNKGGAAKFVEGVLRRLVQWSEESTAVSLYLKQSCLTDSLQWGFAQNYLLSWQGRMPAEVRLRLQALMDQSTSNRNYPCTVSWQRYMSLRNYAQHRFPAENSPNMPRFIILTDGNCGSDGEFLVYALALLPNSVVVGTCTAGVGGFARPGYFMLPHTRAGFRLAAGLTDIYGDGRSFDGYGLRVDVLPPPQPLGPQLLIKLVQSLNESFGA